MARLLLVEDNELNLDMLKRRLERRGYEVLVARDGQAAVEVTRREHPDLVLMDISLPLIDGFEATRQLKGAPETRAIPILALTAHALPSDREQCQVAGCDDYDTKPVDFARLAAKIEALLGKEPS